MRIAILFTLMLLTLSIALATSDRRAFAVDKRTPEEKRSSLKVRRRGQCTALDVITHGPVHNFRRLNGMQSLCT